MEPLSTTLAFATVIGLLADYKSLKKDPSSEEFEEFIQWLAESNHEELLDEIKSNQRLAISIKSVINQSNQEFQSRFDRIDSVLVSIASGLDLFSELATTLKPNIEISSQASSIVRQLVESGAKSFIWFKVLSGDNDELILIGGNKSHINYEELRFLEDDLETISELGLVRVTYGSKGEPSYHVTRTAVEYVNAILN